MADIDSRITSVDHLLASNATDIAKAAAIPGAVVEPPRVVENGPPEEAWVLGGMFMVIVLLPLSIAWARRIWRRSAAAVASFPREIGDRLLRMEQALEATSVEVERIGEGQRFLTRPSPREKETGQSALVRLSRSSANRSKPRNAFHKEKAILH